MARIARPSSRRRYGEATFPVDVVTTFADGEQMTEQWNGLERRVIYTYDRPSRAAPVQVDPRARAAARRELHEQQPHARAARRRGQPEVGLTWMVVAAGPDAHLCVLRLI